MLEPQENAKKSIAFFRPLDLVWAMRDDMTIVGLGGLERWTASFGGILTLKASEPRRDHLRRTHPSVREVWKT